MVCSKCQRQLQDDASFVPIVDSQPNNHLNRQQFTVTKICTIRSRQTTPLLISFFFPFTNYDIEAICDGEVIDHIISKSLNAEDWAVLVGRLISQDWEPISSDQIGRVIMLHKKVGISK